MSPRRASPSAGTAALAVAALVALQFAVLGVARPLARPDPYSDFATFYSAARAFAAGGDAYDPRALRATASFDGWVGRYFYPPPFAAVAVRPLTLLPFAVARRVWIAIEVAAYVAAAWMAAGFAVGFSTRARVLLVVAMALAFAPVYLDLRLGSVSGLLWFAVMRALRARSAARPWRAGAWLAVAVVLKLAPALVLLYCAARREWRVVGAAAATAAVLVVVCLPWTGLDAYRTWATTVVPALAHDSFAWFTNQSLDAFFWRLFVVNPDTTPWVASATAYRIGVTTVTLAVAVLVAVAARGAGGIGSARERLAVTTVLAAAPLVSRVAWEYLFVLALPAFFAWAGRIAGGAATPRLAALVACAWFLCAAPFAYEQSPPRSGAALLLAAPRTYGTVLLVALAAWTAARSRRTGTGDAEA
jgi:alpha-1,2-mannosyltransferase